LEKLTHTKKPRSDEIMRKKLIAVFLLITCSLATNSAIAASTNLPESIKGRLGITGRLGFLVPADNDGLNFGIVTQRAHTDVGFIGGGGFIYGITDNIAAELDITHASFGSDVNIDFDTTNISMGVQYRFLNLPVRRLVPYAGAGLDILLNGANNGLDVDNTVGLHVKAGVDYFLMRELALTSEIKGIIAPNADVNQPGSGKVGEYDPDGFSMTFGLRYFFN
jgi:outer membrane protein